MADVSDILKKAADRIERQGGSCLQSALVAVEPAPSLDCWRALFKALGFASAADMTAWSRAPGRTCGEVVARLREAAAGVRAASPDPSGTLEALEPCWFCGETRINPPAARIGELERMAESAGCSVCGASAFVWPDEGPAYCPEHCPDHEFWRGECEVCGVHTRDAWDGRLTDEYS